MMDLFGDLPEPECENDTEALKQNIEEKKSSAGSEELSSPTALKRKADSERDATPAKHIASDCFGLVSCVAERKGERDDMQDAHVLHEDCTLQFNYLHPSISRVAYFAVFDGHNGSRASRYAATHMLNNIRARFPSGDLEHVGKGLKKCLTDAYRCTDDAFLKLALKEKPSWKDGSTATTVLALNNTLYIANLADSRAVLARYKPEESRLIGLQLTRDHDPQDYSERMRIQKAGGVVKDGRVMGILEVSRSLGDGQYKAHGVSCVPDIRRCALTEHDRFMILACDGLWKTFSAQQAVDFVVEKLEDQSIEATEERSADSLRLERACSELANEAVRKFSGDNVTVILVQIKH